MKKVIIFLISIFLFSFLFASPNKIFAADVKCSTWIEGSITEGSVVKVKVDNVEEYLKVNPNKDNLLYIWISHKSWNLKGKVIKFEIKNSGTYPFSLTDEWPIGVYEVEIVAPGPAILAKGISTGAVCSFSLPGHLVISPEEIEKSNELLCHDNEDCLNCLNQNNSWTAFGCMSTSKPEKLTNSILTFVIGIGGGIAFLLMIFGAFQIILSAGNPDRVKAGKELITAALAGLLLIIFSVFILRVIGYDILGIPGFGR